MLLRDIMDTFFKKVDEEFNFTLGLIENKTIQKEYAENALNEEIQRQEKECKRKQDKWLKKCPLQLQELVVDQISKEIAKIKKINNKI